ncbi:uncharacterized protein LOC112554416 [Pomacea canaliculata]|uniref:uncharacterized protein LOC112554416 n=1 Tax=Pomacea canaliculata TaxID=400727 RepID=UPI000D734BAA|nr:uncharacterized protein LOC112554416 [Pomacea canaliculata]
MGGSWYTDPGSGANYLCLPPNPAGGTIAKPASYSHLGGAEYEVSNRLENNQDALCAVCFVKNRSSNIMIPGTNSCPSGWTTEYTGLLMTGNNGHAGSSEFICVDSKLEGRIDSNADRDGRLLLLVASFCGSLPCPPYQNNNILQCVVCSKFYSWISARSGRDCTFNFWTGKGRILPRSFFFFSFLRRLLQAVRWYVAGSLYTKFGSGANFLCLPPNPVASTIAKPGSVANLYGAEYEVTNRAENDYDALCAVCFVKNRTANIMVPGTNKCPTGWTTEYTGLLMSGYDGHAGSSEYICVDSKLEGRVGSGANNNGRLMYYVAGVCGSLPCPPYVNNNILQCVVCTK